MGRVIQQHIIDVIVIRRLVNESCTRIRIIITSKCYWLIIYQIYDLFLEDRLMIHFLCQPLIIDRLSLNLRRQIPDQITPRMSCVRTIFDFSLYFRRAPINVMEPKSWCVLLSPRWTHSFPSSIFAICFFESPRCSHRRHSDTLFLPVLYRYEPPCLADRRPDCVRGRAANN
jgi:hypothetical protein